MNLARHRMVKFNFVFCDTQAAEKVANCRELGGARIILMGGRGTVGSKHRSDIENYLPKPILRRELLAALAENKVAGESESVALTPEHQPVFERLQVLVVEDNRINQIVARRLIERYGADVVLAADGHEAVKALDVRKYDVVFMDIQMPGMDGLEVTREIRNRERGTPYHQYIVAMTAHAMASDRERCLAAGMDDYLSKPIQPLKLKAILEMVEARLQSALPPR